MTTVSEGQVTSMSPEEIITLAHENHDRVSISFSGAEDVILIDMACNVVDDVQVFTLDTGRLNPETYRFIDKVREHYGVDIEILSPDGEALSRLVTDKGLFSFYKDGHEECCGIRKIAPLRDYLQTVDAWITGQRQDQSPTRADVPQQQPDTAFGTDAHAVTKYNPLANWSSTQVWDYIRENDVPYNELHDRGFQSIGCEPCTRPIGPNMHERAGRWWWEEATQRECGLHIINVKEA
ncbi:MAG: phosphoadenylyl-sulfate reductase [Gammaproteobacteria bacterium]|uniref:Adenosine 5'-phosphosulfate reductase n=1 Tax=OM182 bacterium MED-G24 TaxID=1986255 RepID=A0A2A5WTF9_9GAMM|nr:phosphoadenylyl-sulfate reductase [Gammaproteobacteria bacterium]PDH39840.1 MAG: phosphoadenylyl-sulfate reductase [OM182 bacterium MED-G24]RPG25620.1 MAG: phosphoadenylyl-sulfate reductase [Gammaproteobacteria bacterium TMED50]